MWTLDSDSAVPAWKPAADPHKCFAFSTRRGGVSAPPYDSLNLGRSTADRPDAVSENRRRLLVSLDLDPEALATAGQVHGARVTLVLGPGHHDACDGLVTRRPGVALAVTTADCLPILYAAAGAVGAAHSGWRGTAAGIPRITLESICEISGEPPSRVRVHLGPCIRACCYEVGEEVARRFPASISVREGNAWRLDLAAAARLQLLEAGVPGAAIEDVGACTSCEPTWYYSHRRDAGLTGRHWAIAALR